MTPARSLLRAGAVAVLLFAWTRAAQAEGPRVAVVRPPEGDAVLAEATTRVQAELAAAGFDVAVLDWAPGKDAEALVESAGLDPAPLATLTMVRGDSGARADIWIDDRFTGKTLVRHVDVRGLDPGRAPSVLSVRAVELLRASLLEATSPREDAPPRPPLPVKVAAWVAPEKREPERDSGAFRVEIGAGFLAAFRGASPAFSPLARLGWGTSGYGGRLTIVAPAFGAEVTSDAGSASVRQEIAALEVVGAWPARGVFAAVASLGFGGYHARIDGSASAPFVGRHADRWGVLGDAGVGGAVRFGSRSGLLLDAHALVHQPRLAVRVGDEIAASTLRPAFLATLGFWEAF